MSPPRAPDRPRRRGRYARILGRVLLAAFLLAVLTAMALMAFAGAAPG